MEGGEVERWVSRTSRLAPSALSARRSFLAEVKDDEKLLTHHSVHDIATEVLSERNDRVNLHRSSNGLRNARRAVSSRPKASSGAAVLQSPPWGKRIVFQSPCVPGTAL